MASPSQPPLAAAPEPAPAPPAFAAAAPVGAPVALDGGCGPERTVPAVRAFYAALNKGDVEGLLALMAEDVEWDCFDLPTSAQKARAAGVWRTAPPAAVPPRCLREAARLPPCCLPPPPAWNQRCGGLSLCEPATVVALDRRSHRCRSAQAGVPWLRAARGRAGMRAYIRGGAAGGLDGSRLSAFAPEKARQGARSWERVCEGRRDALLRTNGAQGRMPGGK